MQLFLITFSALFSVINPLGTVPMFLGLTKDKEASQVKRTALFTSINMLFILCISFYLGEHILHFFGISLSSLKIAGGFIMATSGYALLTGNFTKHKGMKKREKDDAFQRSDISLTPLAIPMLAGPGTISLLISKRMEYPSMESQVTLVSAIILVCVASFLCLISSRVIVKALGASGLNALSRIIGFLVISIGVEYMLSTIMEIFS